MGHVPPPPPPWLRTLDSQAAELVRQLRWRYVRDGRVLWRGRLLWWRRRRAYAACLSLQRLHHHALYGEGSVLHAGPCPRGDSCTVDQLPHPGGLPPARTYPSQALRDPGKPRTV